MDAKQAVLDAIAMCTTNPGPNATEQLVNMARVLVAEYQDLVNREAALTADTARLRMELRNRTPGNAVPPASAVALVPPVRARPNVAESRPGGERA